MSNPLNLKIVYRSPTGLRHNPRNARSHSPKQVAQISSSIAAFGFTNPVLIDEAGEIIAGHGRVAAALQSGLSSVPTITLAHLSSVQKRALMLADNKLALNAGWNLEILTQEVFELSSPNLDFDIGITGFDTPEVDLLLGGKSQHEPDPEDQVEAIDRSQPPISRTGDLWVMDQHRLLCGNALEPAAYEILMAGDVAQMVITDPPYNVKVDGHIGGLGKTHHAEFEMASGEMSATQFQGFLALAFGLTARFANDGAIVMAFMDWRHVVEIMAAGLAAFDELKNICVWDKINGGMGSLYRSQHELIFVFKHGKAPHINNVELGRHGRYRTNIWRFPGASMFRKGRQQDLEDHPTVKPVGLIADAIKDCSKRNGIILDPFGGSGTTMLAAERTGRQSRLIEIDPYYVDVAIRRWQKVTGKAARLQQSGEHFSDVATRRAHEAEFVSPANVEAAE